MPQAAQNLLGKCIGNYRLLRSIGRGSMGEVFEAEHVLVGRRAAVKVLLPELCSYTDVSNRFLNEARAVATLHHEGLVRLFDFGIHEGSAYIVMEHLDGETLADLVRRRGPLPVADTVALARQVASAMASAHTSGVVHRDLKPENIVLVRDAETATLRAKVLDFGIAKLASGSLAGASATRTGQILGTPAFMAPEQCHGASHVDDRADIYALGCVIYFMLTGRPPFVSDGVGATIAAHLYLRPVKPSTYVDGIPAGLEAVVMRLLAKTPEERPSSMTKVDELLAAALSESHSGDEPYEISITTDERVSADSRASTEPAPPLRTFETAGERVARDARATGGATAHGRRVPRWRLGIAAAAVMAIATFAPTEWRNYHADADAEPGAWETMRPVAPRAAFGPAAELPAAEAAASTEERATPATVTVRVSSRPAGAEVVRARDGKVLGVTPLELALPAADEPLVLRIRKQGFVAETIEQPIDRDGRVAVVLSARPRVAPASVLANRPKLAKPVKDGALDPFGD